MKLYVVFQTTKAAYDYRTDEYDLVHCECQGVFDSLEKAVKACHSEMFWIGATNLNEEFPVESVEWPECYDHEGRQI